MKAKNVLKGIVIVSTIAGAQEIARGAPVEVTSKGDGLTFTHYFTFEHTEGANERYVPVQDSELIGGMGKYIELSSLPYPFTQQLSYDTRNKSSTLPIDIRAVLKGKSTAGGCYLRFNVIDPNNYTHRNLTVQEVNPNNPDDPNNTNPIIDVMSLPIYNGLYRYDVPGTFLQNIARMFRVGVYTKLKGDVDENGQVDVNDLKAVTDANWLKTTHDINDNYIGNNYNVGDRNHDGWNDFLDFTIIGEDWWMTEDGNSISKVFTPQIEGPYLAALQESNIKNFYGNKAKKVTVAKIARVLNQDTNHYKGLIPQLAENNRYQSEQSEKPSLKQMLALSENNHNGHLQKPYETIDKKLQNSNHRIFLSRNAKRFV
jgi:hypothetical protein